MDKEVKKEVRDYENYVKLLTKRNNVSKIKFINELNGGLGDEIKSDLKVNKKKTNSIKSFFNKIFKIF